MEFLKEAFKNMVNKNKDEEVTTTTATSTSDASDYSVFLQQQILQHQSGFNAQGVNDKILDTLRKYAGAWVIESVNTQVSPITFDIKLRVCDLKAAQEFYSAINYAMMAQGQSHRPYWENVLPVPSLAPPWIQTYLENDEELEQEKLQDEQHYVEDFSEA